MSNPELKFWGDVCCSDLEQLIRDKIISEVVLILKNCDDLVQFGVVWNIAMAEAAATDWAQGMLFLKAIQLKYPVGCTKSRELFWWCIKHNSEAMGRVLVSWMKEEPGSLDASVLSQEGFCEGLDPMYIQRWAPVLLECAQRP